jgi:4-amino-4-deoxy-L-arabinose transferase-like glycosyltransferase
MGNIVEKRKKAFLYIVLLVAFSCIALTGLNGSLQNVDEVLYARVSRETLEHRSWLIQYKDGKAWFHKSPMIFWMVMLSYKLFGVSDFSAKLPSAIAGIISAFMIFFISRKIFQSEKAGIIGGLLYLSSLQVYVSTHQVAIDSQLVMFLLVTLFFTIKGLENKKNWLLLAGFSNGLVFLTKSILGLVVPASLLLYIFIEKKWEMFHYFIALFILSIVVSSPYFFYVNSRIPDVFVKSFLFSNLIDRFYSKSGLTLRRLLYRLGYGIPFYTVFLLLFTIPFTGGIVALFNCRKEQYATKDILWKDSSKLLSLYFLVTLIGYSLLSGKWPHWTMPMIPPVIIFLGYVLSTTRNRNIYLYISGFSCGATILPLIIFGIAGNKYPTYRDVFIGLAILYGMFCITGFFLFSRRIDVTKGVFNLVIGFFVALTIFTAVTVPLDFNTDIKTFADVVYDDPSPLVVIGSNKVNEGNKKTATIWYLKMRSANYSSLDSFLKRVENVERGTYFIYYKDYSEKLYELYPTFYTLKKGKIWNLGRVD